MVPSWRDQARGNSGSRDDRLTFSCQCHLGEQLRWLRTADRDGESLLGASDIQSLADLGTAYAVIKEVRPMPFSRDMFLQLVLATVVPFLPLLLTLFSFETLLDRLVGVIF
ncbi:hypothetical protein [Aeromonas rivipollensis]|uniref:hypothetical protein n=1 Tax=Aeromonas rivipollensis TaxID=948519 RepID=UPI00399CABA8